MTARVDVGMPTAGRRKYIHDAIASVQAQTFTDWRLILSVNDVSPGQDLSEYLADDRIELRPTGAALTAYGNKNEVIRASTAPYLAILDDDDLWDPGFLERRVEVLDRHPECAFVFSTFIEVDADGAEIGRGFEPFAPAGIYQPDTLMPALLAHPSERLIYTAMLTTLVRRSALEAVGSVFDESLPIIADYELWLRLASRYPAAFLHSWDARYRRHPAQDTHRTQLGHEFLYVLDRVESLLVGDLAHLRPEQAELDRYRSRWLLSLALEAAERGERRPAARMLAEVARLSPRLLLDRRVPAIAAGVALGRAASPLISTARSYIHRRRVAVR
jgi:glycosyltransferase involved in cell wall biosynthesis